MIKQFPLADLLVSSRIGVQISRTEEEWPLVYPSIEARLLKNQDLLDVEPLELAGNEGERFNLKDNDSIRANALRPGDVLVTTKFIDRVGIAAMPKRKLPLPLYVYNNSAVLHPDKRLIYPCYLALWFRSETALNALKAQAKVYSRGMHSISLKILLKLPVLIPPLDRQIEIMQFFNKTRRLRQQYDESIRQRQIELQQNLNPVQ